MTTPSARLGIAKPTTADAFDTAEIADNWQIVDDHPGIFLCTSGTRPGAWGTVHEGMVIYETDTDLYWRWTGSAFVRAFASGWLNGTRRTADLSTTSTTPLVLVSTAVAIPAGGRRVQVIASWGKIENDLGLTQMYLFRDTGQLHSWAVGGDTDTTTPTDKGQGGSMTWVEAPGSGSFTYSLRFAVVAGTGGTSWARAAIDAPVSIDAIEV